MEDLKEIADLNARLVSADESIVKTVRYSREDIAQFARMTHDGNPLHHDAEAAQAGRFGEIIASGQQTSALMMGVLASHFSRHDDGIRREMLGLNFNFAFKHPVFAEQDIEIRWRVASLHHNRKLGGMLVQLDGSAAATPAKPAVIARGTILVRTTD